MRATFVRVPGGRDRIYVQRSDGSEVTWEFPSYGDGLPHDLVHLVVERTYGIRDGFWARVDAGADPARINAEANRRGGRDKYAGFGADRDGLLVAEGFANAPWLDASVDDAELAAALPYAGIAPARVREVRDELHALRDRWRALGAREALVLEVDWNNLR